jgi:tetratricopeptide (TPR) repeat protein
LELTATSDSPERPLIRRKTDAAKKYWWAGAVAVPVLVAAIGASPSLLRRGGGSSGDTYITNSRIGGDLYVTTNVQIADPAARSEFDRGVAFVRQGQFAEAKALFEQIAPTVQAAAVYNNLAVVNAALGDDRAAQRNVQQALQLDPVDQAARQNLTLISRAIQDQGSNSTILTASPIPLGRSVASRLTAADDADFFSFTAPAGPRDILRLRVENKTATFAPELRVFDASRAESGRAYQTTPGAHTSLEFVTVPGATYYAKIGAIYGDVADYELSVTPLRAFDRFEPNDDVVNPADVRVGQPVEAAILDPADSDVYRVVVKPGPVRVAVRNRSATLAPQMVLYNDDKSEVGRHYNATPGGDVSGESQVQRAGTWYVRIGGIDTAGQYTLEIVQ